MRRLVLALLVLGVAAGVLVWGGEAGVGPVVITREGEQKLVLLFGKPTAVRTEPGFSLRWPLVTDVRTFDGRLLYLNTEPLPIQTRDEERLVVDNYVVWRIEDPLVFHAAFPGGRDQAELQIDRVVRADVRNLIGQRTLSEVVTGARLEIMQAITSESNQEMVAFGVEVRDVRINRTELPTGTEQNVYARMRADRQRLARKYRAEGDEEGRRIRAEADRGARVLVAEARREAETLRGEGDAEAARIYAAAHGQAPEFYGFVRRLEAYRKSIGKQTTLVLPSSSDFFRLFSAPGGGRP